MLKSKQQELGDVRLKFGGGLNTRASEDEVNPAECADGRNFVLDLENREFRGRPPILKVATAPNAGEIRGFAQLIRQDGTLSTLVQAGTTVYEWDGTDTGFVSKGTVSASARLRGWLWQNFTLDEKVIITDLSLQENVKEWDGTTFQDVTFTGGTNFKAKYCFVDQERAWYANVNESGTSIPHMLVASEVENFDTISTIDKPASARSVSDPIYMLSPDLRPINGVVNAFGRIVFSSREGAIFNVTGSTAKDYAINHLYPRSFSSGDESMAFIGNDIAYGRPGRLESVLSTDRFGDVSADDTSRKIANQVENEPDWTVVYNSRLDRVYFSPNQHSRVWVLEKSLLTTDLSPWSLWTTQADLDLSPAVMMSLIDPQTNLENVFFGDGVGNVYCMEGSGNKGDAGTTEINATRTSGVFSVPDSAGEAFRMEGYIRYRREEEVSVTITLLWGGQAVMNGSVDIFLPGSSDTPVYSGGSYYSAGAYYGRSFRSRLIRQPFAVPGQGQDFQVEVAVNGTANFSINEVGLKFVMDG